MKYRGSFARPHFAMQRHWEATPEDPFIVASGLAEELEPGLLEALWMIPNQLREKALQDAYTTAEADPNADDFHAWCYLLLLNDLQHRETLLELLGKTGFRASTQVREKRAFVATAQLAYQALGRRRFEEWYALTGSQSSVAAVS
jgi:hypothetical protein